MYVVFAGRFGPSLIGMIAYVCGTKQSDVGEIVESASVLACLILMRHSLDEEFQPIEAVSREFWGQRYL